MLRRIAATPRLGRGYSVRGGSIETGARLRYFANATNDTTPALGGRVAAALPAGARRAPAQPMLTCHYSVHDGFLDETAILTNADALADVPAIAVQGTADTICPPRTAYDLHGAWPELELVLVGGAGHSMYDPDIQHELLEATDRMHGRLFGDGVAT